MEENIYGSSGSTPAPLPYLCLCAILLAAFRLQRALEASHAHARRLKALLQAGTTLAGGIEVLRKVGFVWRTVVDVVESTRRA